MLVFGMLMQACVCSAPVRAQQQQQHAELCECCATGRVCTGCGREQAWGCPGLRDVGRYSVRVLLLPGLTVSILVEQGESLRAQGQWQERGEEGRGRGVWRECRALRERQVSALKGMRFLSPTAHPLHTPTLPMPTRAASLCHLAHLLELHDLVLGELVLPIGGSLCGHCDWLFVGRREVTVCRWGELKTCEDSCFFSCF